MSIILITPACAKSNRSSESPDSLTLKLKIIHEMPVGWGVRYKAEVLKILKGNEGILNDTIEFGITASRQFEYVKESDICIVSFHNTKELNTVGYMPAINGTVDKNKQIWLITDIEVLHPDQSTGSTIKISPDLELIKLSNNAYIHVSWYNIPKYGRISANGLVYLNKDEAFLFNTPWTDSLTSELYCYLTDTMHLKIAGFIPNHWHQDCMGGLGFLQERYIPAYANQMTIDIAKSKQLSVPDHGFKKILKLQLGDRPIECYYPGAAHSTDNIVVWLPSEKILFAGCMVKSMVSTDLGNTVDGDLKAYPGTIKKLLKKYPDAKIVIPGHGQFGGPELIAHTIEIANH